MQDDMTKNISWRDSNHSFDTKLTTPTEWKELFDNIELNQVELFLKDTLHEVGGCYEIFPQKTMCLMHLK